MGGQEPLVSLSAVVVATRNRDKLAEIRRLLGRRPLRLLTLDDIGFPGDIEENGQTYSENALLKATAAAQYRGLPAIGEDSGIEVSHLRDERGMPFPGLRSRRWLGPDATEMERNLELLHLTEGLEPSDRLARMVAAVALVIPGQPPVVFEGEARGRIVMPRGAGFGYDPIFWSDDLRMTLAMAPLLEKDAISHRGRAIRALVASGALGTQPMQRRGGPSEGHGFG